MHYLLWSCQCANHVRSTWYNKLSWLSYVYCYAENCPANPVVLRKPKGTIQKGLFFGGVGLQVYAPGQSCTWEIRVPGAEFITLDFETVALTYDELDYITVLDHKNVVQKKLTGFGKNVKVTVCGDAADIHFHSYGGRSPQPASAGFILNYTSGKSLETLMPIVFRLARTPQRDWIVCWNCVNHSRRNSQHCCWGSICSSKKKEINLHLAMDGILRENWLRS